MAAPVKKKRISKKTKAAWRKTDINDVETFLEEQRQDERIGGSLFAAKKDEDLFTVDATPQKLRRGLTEKQKRKLNAKKPMKSFQAMENTSKVQDPIAKRNHVKPMKNGRNIEDEIRNPSKPRHIQANKDRGHYYDRLEKRMNKTGKALRFNKDVWAENDFRDKVPGLKDEKGWISRDLALHVMRNKGKSVVKVHDSLRHRTTKAKNFEPPHPGTSYNPSLEDHQALLSTVVEREEKIIKVEKHLKRITTDMFSKVTPEERDARKFFEMQAGLNDDDDDDDDDGDSGVSNDKDEKTDEKADVNDAPYQTVNPPVEVKKKSKQARRKELRQKELQKKQMEKKALKKQIADLNRIKSIKAEVMAEEEALNALKKHRKAVAHKKKFEPKRLGRLKYEEPDVDIVMAEEITGDLRNLKAGSSLLVDRFKNFQKRNMLPVSVDVGKQKKKKIKRFVRSTHKEPGVTHEMLREQRKAKAAATAAATAAQPKV